MRSVATIITLLGFTTQVGCVDAITRTYEPSVAGGVMRDPAVHLVRSSAREVELEFDEGATVPGEGVVRTRHSEGQIAGGTFMTIVGGGIAASAAACAPDHGGGFEIGPSAQGLCIGGLALLGAAIAITGFVFLGSGLRKHPYVSNGRATSND